MLMKNKRRRLALVETIVVGSIAWILAIEAPNFASNTQLEPASVAEISQNQAAGDLATEVLETLEVKGRAPKTGYKRAQFGDGWAKSDGCDTRNIILRRDLNDAKLAADNCKVERGTLSDPYTGEEIVFERGAQTSSAVQVDHVVALSNAWQTGAQQLSEAERIQLANDPLELLAVDGPANQQKGDGDAATWLPSNKPFRCQYVARQLAVKRKYRLWLVAPEKDAIKRVLASCPEQRLPV